MPCFYRDGICDCYTPTLKCCTPNCCTEICMDCHHRQYIWKQSGSRFKFENYETWKYHKFECEDCLEKNKLKRQIEEAKRNNSVINGKLEEENQRLKEQIKDLQNDNTRMRKVLLKTYFSLQHCY